MTAESAATGKVFAHRRAALDWLNAQGYKCSQGKFSQDCKRGLCAVNEDGTLTEASVLFYATRWLKRTNPPDGSGAASLQEEKTRLEVELLELKGRRQTFELEREQGKWLPRKDLGLELAARAGVLDQGVQNFFRTRTGDWVIAVGGDVKKVGMVLDMILTEWDELLAEYADREQFHVIFGEEEV